MVEACGDVYYSEPTDTMRGTRSYREGPPPRVRMQEEQRRLDTPVPSWADIDTRISQWLEAEPNLSRRVRPAGAEIGRISGPRWRRFGQSRKSASISSIIVTTSRCVGR
jgi:hypothetical protein